MARTALLVGINKYAIPNADLRGCVNDVKNVRALLRQFFGFNSGDITVLIDKEATQKNILNALQSLLKGAKAGDVLVFHNSSHGSQVPDAPPRDEDDNYDEILVPYDVDWYKPLLDDSLKTMFDKVPGGVNFTVIMDCCHSGTNVRALPNPMAPVIPRYLPSPWQIAREESASRAKREVKVKGSLRGDRNAKVDVLNVAQKPILIAGCRPNQTSADAYIGNSFNGALTYYIVQSTKEKKGKLTNLELRNRTAQLLRQNGYSQIPQLEGKEDYFNRSFLQPLV
jgi:hypothetical protein